MSGPKVVRIVTREEIIALCNGLLQRLQHAAERWQRQAQRVGALDQAELAATQARHARLQALLAEDRFSELQRAVPVEIEFLQRDLREREAQAIERATQQRQQGRQIQQSASAVINALHASGESVDSSVLDNLAQLARDPQRSDADRVLAQGLAQLAKPAAAPALSQAQRALAEQLKGPEITPSYAQWLAAHSPDTVRDQRLQRIDRHIVELQLLQGDEVAQPFVAALQRAEAQPSTALRNLQLDSLVIELAASTRAFEQRRQHLEHLQDLAGELQELATEQTALLEQIAGCHAGSGLASLDALTAQAQTALDAHAQALAAQARREAVLQGLASLGYEVREGMSTAWAEAGQVVLRKPATPGYGVEVGGSADTGRLQVRAVALTRERDTTRDRDIETLWCGDFTRLQALLEDQGDALLIERALAVGEVPLKEVEHSEPETARERGLLHRR